MEHLPFLRFHHGNGKLYDTCEADDYCMIDRDSFITEDSSLFGTDVRSSSIAGSVITNSRIVRSQIAYSSIVGGVIIDSEVTAEYVGNVAIENSVIHGKSRVFEFAKCSRVRFKDLTVRGSAQLRNWPGTIFDGCHGYVSRGVWQRPPRVVRLPFDVSVTESITDEDGLHAFVACREFLAERWLKIGDRYGRARGWSPEQVQSVRDVLNHWLETPVSNNYPSVE